ncbi:beta/gamma crystallin-related protein [Chlorogloeopsis fritschii PCC 9212]|uniref:Beta/gamma crystallin 'Greek key' domain-containing protein n=1 Tax=Chlorogloeopsis fritschii PCC 6912 TaxID=211165 RepID=A0A3S0ZTX6_CHLFR|nr:beta/gamma crystallin-related protein [Chlorogloeopsis fritschii]RUR72214.1 hypothetical protein PCC6912_64310 [Chlorogloeopsis fritschii PCC 6912]
MKEFQNEQLFQELDNELATTYSGGAAYLYQDAGYQGRKLTFYKGHNDLRYYDFNDKTSSIKITAGETWRFWQNINREGKYLTLSGGRKGAEYNAHQLKQWGFHDNISSLKRIA